MIWTDEIKLDIIYPIYIYGSFLGNTKSRVKDVRYRATYQFIYFRGAD